MTEIDLDKEPPHLFNGGPGDTVLLTYSFNISLYSLDMATPQQKEAVIAIFDEYAALYGSRMNWTTNPVSGKFKHIRGKADGYLTPDEWLREEPKENGIDILFHGGEKMWDSSDVVFMAKAASSSSNKISTISCRFPIADVRSGKLNMPDIMQRWCALLRPHHARGGYSAGWWYEGAYSLGGKIHARLKDQLLFYPGLQFDGTISELNYDYTHKAGLHDGPRCADWLIALSDSFLENLGGLDAVTKAMSPCPVLPYEGGAVLQAGDAPGPGRDGDPESLPDYLRLGRVIEPVRAQNLSCVIAVPDSFSYEYSPELSEKWCTRFSGKKTARRKQ